MNEYKFKDVLKLLQICARTYRSKKQEVLEYLSFYWDYELIDDKYNPIFQVYEEKAPLEPFPKYKRLSDKALEDILFPIIAKDPLQTAANLARIVYSKKPRPSGVKVSQKVFEGYTRKMMKLWFGDGKETFEGTAGYIGNKVWVTLVITENGSRYQRMTREQINNFFDMFNINDEKTKERIIDTLNSYSLKELRKQDVNRIIGNHIIEKYLQARQRYHDKYGGWPFRVSEKWLRSKEQEEKEWGWK